MNGNEFGICAVQVLTYFYQNANCLVIVGIYQIVKYLCDSC